MLTSGFKARIEASIDPRFMPFHANATCMIRPEGLIAENYLECDPGTAGSPVLHAGGGYPPTVPVTRTTEPVSLLDLFNTFNLPTRERMAAIVDELGIATAGRGQDLNQILERANPALGAARDAISVLTSQQTQLQTLIDSSNQVAAEGASDTAGIQRFLDEASSLTSVTAEHASPLSQSIAKLPALLGATRPALMQLDAIAAQGTPLLQQLRAAAPSVNQVANDLGPFAQAAKPALAKMSVALSGAIPAIRHSTPLLRSMRSYASRSKANTALAARLFTNIQRNGFTESFLSVVYYTAAALARVRRHLASAAAVRDRPAERRLRPVRDQAGGRLWRPLRSAGGLPAAGERGGRPAECVREKPDERPRRPSEPAGRRFALRVTDRVPAGVLLRTAGTGRAGRTGRAGPVDPGAGDPGPDQLPAQMKRSRHPTVLASPMVVGTIIIVVLGIAVYLSYIAENGLPFIPTYRVNVQVANADEVGKNADVRIGGARVGQVLTITPEPASRTWPHPYAGSVCRSSGASPRSRPTPTTRSASRRCSAASTSSSSRGAIAAVASRTAECWR